MSKPDDRAIAMVTASLLRRGKMLHHIALIFPVFALVLIIVRRTKYALPLGVSLLLGVAEFWFALRVALDADLFGGLASEKTDTAGMDKALAKLGLVKEGKTGRSMEDRAKGGLRLLKLQTLCLAGQIAAFSACFFMR